MRTLSAALFILTYFTLVLALRTAVHHKKTGASGFVAKSGSPAEATAGALLILGTALLFFAPLSTWAGLDPLLYTPVFASDLFAVVLLILGTAGTWWAQSAMGPSWRIGVDDHARTELVTAGPFKVIRNPIFTFMIAAAIGFFVYLPNLETLAAAIALFAGIELQVRYVEEPYLTKTHGAAYRSYTSSTGRFLPKI